jgi:hypothetical protein
VWTPALRRPSENTRELLSTAWYPSGRGR